MTESLMIFWKHSKIVNIKLRCEKYKGTVRGYNLKGLTQREVKIFKIFYTLEQGYRDLNSGPLGILAPHLCHHKHMIYGVEIFSFIILIGQI